MLFWLAITDIKWALFIQHKYLSHWLNTSKSRPPTRRWKRCLVWPSRRPPPPHSYWFQSYNLCRLQFHHHYKSDCLDSGCRMRTWTSWEDLQSSHRLFGFELYGHMHTDTLSATGQCHVLRVAQGQTGSLFILNACILAGCSLPKVHLGIMSSCR